MLTRAGGWLWACGTILVLAAGGAVAGENEAAAAPPDAKVFFLATPNAENPFYVSVHRILAAKAAELGYVVELRHHGYDIDRQAACFREARERRAAAMFLFACEDSKETIDQIAEARRAGLPSFLLDREIAVVGVAMAQITANNLRGGQMAANYFAVQIGDEGEYLVVGGRATERNAIIRARGFREVLDRYPKIKRVAEIDAGWQRESAREQVAGLLKKHPALKGALCANDTMALGVRDAFRAAGRTDAVIVGFDGTDEARDAILAGEISATVLQPAAEMAERAVLQADGYLRLGKAIESEKQTIDCTLITRANARRLDRFVLSK